MYELFYIIPAKYTEEEVEAAHAKVATALEKRGATLHDKNMLGKQKLAYSIAKFKFGHEATLAFEVSPEKLQEIQQDLRLMNEVGRFMVAHQVHGAKPLRFEDKRRVVKREERTPAAPVVQAPKAPPALSEEQLEKEIEKILEEPVV